MFLLARTLLLDMLLIALVSTLLHSKFLCILQPIRVMPTRITVAIFMHNVHLFIYTYISVCYINTYKRQNIYLNAIYIA